MDNNYIESVWWVFKQLWDKQLVERNYRVSPYCPRCGTTLSNFEVNQGYKEVKDNQFMLNSKLKKAYIF
jgi:Isoleucyl-tRNA synthetase